MSSYAMTSIYRCTTLSGENEQLGRKLRKLRQKYELLENQLSNIQEKLQHQRVMQECNASRDVQVQTELQPWLQKGLQNVKPKPENNPLSDLYSTLLQRYEKQMQFNKEQSDLILELYGRLQSQETQLQAAQDVVDQCNLLPLNRRSSGAGRKTVYTSEKVSACKCASQIFCDPHCHYTEFRVEIEKLQKENARLSKEKDILKMELALLDKDFFEEIEDLKFALQESAQLNQKYEKYIKQISLRYGLPVPGAYSYYSE